MMIKVKDNQSIEFKYNEEKATQAALYLLEKTNGSMEYIRLIKLLYLADRKALLETGRSITTDKFVSMKHGTVVSRILNHITKADSNYWSSHIELSDEVDVKIVRQIELLKLSDYEEDILDSIFQEFNFMSTWGENGLIEFTHRLPEWEKKAKDLNTSFPISLKTILKEGYKEEEIDSILEDIQILSQSKY